MRSQVLARLIPAICAAILCSTVATAAEELVRIESARLRLGDFQKRQAEERGEVSNPPDIIQAYLSRPNGNGPFPAIVYLHGCGGLSRSTRDAIAALMTAWGYVTLAVDSFSSRGLNSSCDNLISGREGDARAALRHLSVQKFVDPRRIAVVGSSQGAIVALQLASDRPNFYAVPDDLKFKAVVAYYPECSSATEQLTLPTIILIGELDDWTPAKDCERWMERRAGKGASVRLMVYPGAYHGFDNPAWPDGHRVFGHWIKYDADAAQRSIVEMRKFLAAQIGK